VFSLPLVYVARDVLTVWVFVGCKGFLQGFLSRFIIANLNESTCSQLNEKGSGNTPKPLSINGVLYWNRSE